MRAEQVQQLRAGRPRQFDAEVAEHVYQWEHLRQRRAGEWAGLPPDEDGVSPVPDFSEPYHDYATLVMVRETWGPDAQLKWIGEMRGVLLARGTEFDGADALGTHLYYQPGDYSESALRTVLSYTKRAENGGCTPSGPEHTRP